jgi:hypothetical protein
MPLLLVTMLVCGANALHTPFVLRATNTSNVRPARAGLVSKRTVIQARPDAVTTGRSAVFRPLRNVSWLENVRGRTSTQMFSPALSWPNSSGVGRHTEGRGGDTPVLGHR